MNSKAAELTPIAPSGDSLKDNLAFYWFIVIAINLIIIFAV
jgi:hypothetical protein